MKTAVDTVFVGKERAYNRRFLQMCSHYLVDPVACTPAAGWEKGQVENQVGTTRERLFAPRVRVKSMAELNDWLLDQCVARAKVQPHPEIPGKTVWEVFEAERASLVPYRGPFDGFHAVQASVSKTCLVRFDNNKYSVEASAVGRPVEVRAYADRIELRQDGRVVGTHARAFGRGGTVYNPWHYVPVLARKPGALRNGAPFKHWVLPAAIERVRAPGCGPPAMATARWSRSSARWLERRAARGRGRLRRGAARGRPFRRPSAVASGARTGGALAGNSSDQWRTMASILNMPRPTPRSGPAGHDHDAGRGSRLTHAPVADCSRYDSLEAGHSDGTQPGSGRVTPEACLRHDGRAQARRARGARSARRHARRLRRDHRHRREAPARAAAGGRRPARRRDQRERAIVRHWSDDNGERALDQVSDDHRRAAAGQGHRRLRLRRSSRRAPSVRARWTTRSTRPWCATSPPALAAPSLLEPMAQRWRLFEPMANNGSPSNSNAMSC